MSLIPLILSGHFQLGLEALFLPKFKENVAGLIAYFAEEENVKVVGRDKLSSMSIIVTNCRIQKTSSLQGVTNCRQYRNHRDKLSCEKMSQSSFVTNCHGDKLPVTNCR